jgi:23S rRNA pseudouridine2604 synthase
MKEEDLIDYPIRINRYLELKGVATRRGADELINKGLVLVNGQPAIIGYKVQARDKVEVLAGAEDEKRFIYLAYYKPRGLATEDIKIKTGVFPLGRLDKESEGLIILTNDGRITDRLLNPQHAHEKEYEVEVKEKVSPMHKKILEGGVTSRVVVKGYRQTEKLRAKQVEITGSQAMRIILTEGKKHQIRRMLAGAHLTVSSLKRVRIMDIKLGKLRPDQTKAITGQELKDFLAMLY